MLRQLVLVVLSLCVCNALRKTLVLVDDLSIQATHSKFLNSLKEHGGQVEVKLAKNDELELKKYGEFLYDSLVLFAPETKDFGGDIDENLILEFLDAGSSLIIAGGSKVSKVVREISSECGVEFDKEKTSVIDHANYDAADDGLHTLIAADHFSSSPILGKGKFAPVLYQGLGLLLNDENGLTSKLLYGAPTTYSANPTEPVKRRPNSAGSDTILVAAVQTLGRGRVIVSGSLDLFSDKSFNAAVNQILPNGDVKPATKSGNEAFVHEIVSWVQQNRGVLRVHSVVHQKADGSEVRPRMYRVKDEVIFSIVIEEYDGATDSWKPYVADDVQLEFRMLHPYVRRNLTPAGNGTFSTQFTLPDVYGVFKFTVDYRRDGFSHVQISEEAGVRPFRHNEFERFIASAYPYYVSAFSMMGGFVVFSVVFLFTKDNKEKRA